MPAIGILQLNSNISNILFSCPYYIDHGQYVVQGMAPFQYENDFSQWKVLNLVNCWQLPKDLRASPIHRFQASVVISIEISHLISGAN